jgi:hypothetical protein
MTLTTRILPLLLTTAVVSTSAQEHGEFQLVLELNYLSAEKALELYQGLSGNPSEVARLRGSQLAMATTALLAQRRLDLSSLESALGAVKFNQSLGDDVFRLAEARANVGAIKELYDELHRRNFGQRVAGTVEQLFPPGARVRGALPIYFVAFGHQNIDAFVRRVTWEGDRPLFVGEGEGEPTIVVNLAKAVRYGRSVDERFIGLLSTVAHEVFHAAFAAYKDQSPAWHAYYSRHQTPFDVLLDLTHNEGIAYYLSLIQTSHGRLPADWQQRVGSALGTFSRSAQELLSPGVSQRRAEEILRTSNTSGYWESFGSIAGMIIAKQIDQGLGRQALTETIAKGPLDFFWKYVELSRRNPDISPLSPAVVQALQQRLRQ